MENKNSNYRTTGLFRNRSNITTVQQLKAFLKINFHSEDPTSDTSVTLASRIETSNQTTRQYSNHKLQSRMRTDNSARETVLILHS